MRFEYSADRAFFRALLCKRGQVLAAFEDLFDFRKPRVKRAEFNRIAKQVRQELEGRFGQVCHLQLDERCDPSASLTVDHLIPLSSNKLNKELRKLRPRPGRKVASQSFGSNRMANLVLACGHCNGHKKHRLLEPDVLVVVMKRMAAGERYNGGPSV